MGWRGLHLLGPATSEPGMLAAADLLATAFAHEAEEGGPPPEGPVPLLTVLAVGLMWRDGLPKWVASFPSTSNGWLVRHALGSHVLPAGLALKGMSWALKPAGTEPEGAGDARVLICSAFCCTAATHWVPAAIYDVERMCICRESSNVNRECVLCRGQPLNDLAADKSPLATFSVHY